MRTLLDAVEKLNTWVGKSFGWCIIILTAGMCYEVFMRYVLGRPTGWSYDLAYMMYGALFLMAGPYAISRGSMVRGDFLYRLWRPRIQALVDLILYLLFFFPGVVALIYGGWLAARQSWRFGETSIYSPIGVPVYPMRTLIPIAGVLLFLQGVCEVARCVQCLREGAWPPRRQDVEELETVILREHAGGQTASGTAAAATMEGSR